MKEPLSGNPEGMHVGSDCVLTEFLGHLDDARPRHPWLCHDEVIALDAVLNATEEPANVAQFLPGDSFHASTERNAAAW